MNTAKMNLSAAMAKFNNAKVSSDRRENIVAKGRVLVLEQVGRAHNEALVKAGRKMTDYGSTFKNNSQYQSEKVKWCDDVLYFCAEKSLSFADIKPNREDRSTYTDISLATNPLFLNLLSGIISEIQYSITPPLVNELVGEMASVMMIPKGQTGEVEISSNAVFEWEDASWTSLRSVPQDQLYNGTITLNPKPVATKFHMNWYQMVGNNGSLVDTIAAVSGGYAAMLMEKFSTAFLAAAADTRYVPAARTATGYTDSNWATIVRNVAAANRVRRDQLVAYGDFLALRNVLPDNATLAPAIMTLLGDEYFRNGYLMSHDGVMLYELTPTVTPETINTTMTSPFPTDTIVIAARANMRYAPMILGFEENGDGRVNLTPGDDVIANGYIEGIAYASLDIAPAFASAIGVITNV